MFLFVKYAREGFLYIEEQTDKINELRLVATWLFNSPDKSLAFILADNGFGAWIGNNRGTESSRGSALYESH